ncbi:Gfo/Idh/MocA family oxidoreductase [Rhodobacteraceae bacterium]|nr:Gfo/Idh/MocA family oxidoreductase [Paracoccaceae bacterium]
MSRKLALVGIGKIARDQHIPALAANPDFKLVATTSRNASVAGVTAYTDLASLLKSERNIECVSLCTPPMARYDDARRALLAGCHVMLEKPPGATLSEVHDLEALADQKNITLFASWHSRHAAAVPAARDWLAEKTIVQVLIEWKEDVRYWHPGQDWIWQAGGLGVFDPSINALSILTEIMPHAIHLTDAVLTFPENRETPVAAFLTFRGSHGSDITGVFNWLEQGPPKWDITVKTNAGVAVLSEGGAKLAIDGVPVKTGPHEEYPSLYKRFSTLVHDGKSDVDLAPLTHVADAFMMGKREFTEAFEW